jgi:hypothetical protein
VTKGSLSVVLCALVLAGCGGGHDASQVSSIRQALERSRLTYLHYRAPIWWGRRVSVTVELVRVDGDWAIAKLRGPKSSGRQWALLHRSGGWRVVGAASGRGTGLWCKLAPPPVIPQLVGGCTATELWAPGDIVGPRARRAPTGAERTALESAARRLRGGRDSCVRYLIGVSEVDPRYVRVSYEFHKPYGNCLLSNGDSIFVRDGRDWRHVSDASDPFPCTLAPPGVVRSLFGDCWTA